jgi:hypothetical protein
MGVGIGRGVLPEERSDDGGLWAGVVSMWLSIPPEGVLTVGFRWFVWLSGWPGMRLQL